MPDSPPTPPKQVQPSWRMFLGVHPAAKLFPRPPLDQVQELGEDIKKNGLTSPIALIAAQEGGYKYWVLDGITRLDAMALVGIPFKVVLEGARRNAVVIDTDPWAYVISANIRRRHLSAEDKDRLIVELLKA